MKDENPVTVVLSNQTVMVLEAIALRLQLPVDCIISMLIWDASRWVFTQKELILLLETKKEKK